MSLEETRNALADRIRALDERRDRQLSRIGPPRSVADCERERFQRQYVVRAWERERDPLFTELCKFIAAEVRDGILFLNPVEREHYDRAIAMIRQTTTPATPDVPE